MATRDPNAGPGHFDDAIEASAPEMPETRPPPGPVYAVADGSITTSFDAPALGTDTRVAPATEATRLPVSRTRLAVGLVVWDSLVPAALLTLVANLEKLVGAGTTGGAEPDSDKLALALAILSPIALLIAGGYQHRRRRGGSRLLFGMRLLVVGIVVTWMAIILGTGLGWPIDYSQMLAVTLLLPAAWLLGRWACDRHPATSVADRVLVVGSGVMAERVVQLTARHRERHMRVVGRLDADQDDTRIDGPPRLGDIDDLPAVLERERIDRVLVAFAPGRDSQLLDALRHCVAQNVQVDIVPRFFDLVGPSPRAHTLGDLALVEVPGRTLTAGQKLVKRTVDVVGAAVLILVLSPVLLATAAAVAIRDGRPVLYRQTRIGRAGREFSILKFRTMRVTEDDVPDGDGAISAVVRELKSNGELRLTPLGRTLRRTSLDELPQFLNVLRGDMSLVGPRPLRSFEVGSLTPWQLARQDLRPGLTGLWQVLGRSGIEWDERMQLDYSYVAHWSFASDLRILARTLPAVVRGKGAI